MPEVFVIGLLLALFFIWMMYMSPDTKVCMQCGGRDKHREGCPFGRDE